jgi:Xaa-Pro aminopeptidase
MLSVPLSERDDRLRRIREQMAARGLDALVIGAKGHWWTGRGYLRYLADFHLWGHDALIVLGLEGEPAVSVTSPAVAAMIARRGWVEDARGDMLVVPSALAALRERGLAAATIGVVGGEWIIPAGIADALAKELPGARLQPADDLLDGVRMVKSRLEIEQNRAVWALAQSAMERFQDVLADGAESRAVCSEAAQVALAGGARDILMLVGDRPDAFGPPDERPLRCDEIVRFHMEINGESGHWCELTTTLCFRPPSEAEQRLVETELRARERVGAAARPGVRLSELAALFEDTLTSDGWQLGAPTTHFDFHGQGQDVIELPWFAAEQPWGSTGDTELLAGTVLSYHPRRNVEDPGIRWYPGVSDNLAIGEAGSEWLSIDWPHQWREVAR